MGSWNLLAHSVIVAAVLFGASTWAHDTGTPYADWMKSLIRPDYPMSYCCGPGDQYYVREYQPSQKHGVAFTAIVLSNDGRPDFPVEIPREKVIWDRVNPTGRGVIFLLGREVLCFVPGIGM
jgi:hypothetical protein